MSEISINSINKFTLKEKLFAQFTFHGGVLIGTYGLFKINPILGIAFFSYSYIGILTFMRYTSCPRCPHLHIANDCVQLPARLTKKIISPSRKGSFNIYEKILYFTVLYGILLFPIYWLLSDPLVLTIFLVLYGGTLLGLYFHFCKHCQNKACVQCKHKN